MATEKQIAANRQNSKKSTGPRTPEGKAHVGENPIKHGLTAKRVILPDEDPADFEQFRDALWDELAPLGALEEVFAATFVTEAWRQRRITGLEAALSARHLEEPIITKAQHEVHRLKEQLQQKFNRLLGISLAGMQEEQLKQAWRSADPDQRKAISDATDELAAAEQKLADAERRIDVPALRMAGEFEVARESYAILSRYRASCSRSMFSALHELQRLQAARAGSEVAPPDVVDVHVHHGEHAPQSNGAAPRESAAVNGGSPG